MFSKTLKGGGGAKNEKEAAISGRLDVFMRGSGSFQTHEIDIGERVKNLQ